MRSCVGMWGSVREREIAGVSVFVGRCAWKTAECARWIHNNGYGFCDLVYIYIDIFNNTLTCWISWIERIFLFDVFKGDKPY